MRARSVFLLGGVLTLVGCAGLLGFEDFVGGTAAQEGGEAGAPEGGLADGLEEAHADWYVSPSGDDGADGSREAPLRSLEQAAARAARALGSKAPQTIAVCEGKYALEALVLTGRIEVLGGYECRSWTRAEAADDMVGAMASVTKLTSATAVDAMISLVPGTSGAPRLDRLELESGLASIVILSQGATVLSHLTVTATVSPLGNPKRATVGISVSDSRDPDAGAPEVEPTVDHCTVLVQQAPGAADGGAAPAETIGSALSLTNGRHRVRRNSLGVAGIRGRCVGVLAGSSDARLEQNVVQLSNCIAPESESVSSIGLSVVDSTITSERNAFRIEAPGGESPSTPPLAIGVSVRGKTSLVTSDGDRVNGPITAAPGNRSGLLAFKGFEDLSGAFARVVNASVVLDSRGYALGSATGIYLLGPTTALVAHNSMYFAQSKTDGDALDVRGILVTPRDPDAGVDADAGGVTIASNFVATDEPRMTFVFASCTAREIEALAHNRYGEMTLPARGPDCPNGTIDDLWPDAGGDGNVALACPADGCATLFTSVPTAATDGLRLADAGCALAAGVPSRPDVSTDGAGRARGATTTAGAFACE